MNLLIQIIAMFISLFIIWLFFMLFVRPRYNEKKIFWASMCPKCGSLDVKKTFLTRKKFFLSLNQTQSKCNSCMYIGFFPEVDVERVEEIREKYLKKNKPSKNSKKSKKTNSSKSSDDR